MQKKKPGGEFQKAVADFRGGLGEDFFPGCQRVPGGTPSSQGAVYHPSYCRVEWSTSDKRSHTPSYSSLSSVEMVSLCATIGNVDQSPNERHPPATGPTAGPPGNGPASGFPPPGPCWSYTCVAEHDRLGDGNYVQQSDAKLAGRFPSGAVVGVTSRWAGIPTSYAWSAPART